MWFVYNKLKTAFITYSCNNARSHGLNKIALNYLHKTGIFLNY